MIIEKVTVSVDFVKQAHNAACGEWKRKIEKEFPSLFEEKYRAGTRISIITIHDTSEYLLVNIGTKAYLNSLKNGNVWHSDAMDYSEGYVTEKQLDKYILGSNEYERIWKFTHKNI